MPVSVQFAVRSERGFDVEPGPEVVPDEPFHDWYGRLLFAAEGREVFVEDDLTALIASCFEAVARLSAGEDFGAYVTRYPGEYGLAVAGEDTTVSGPSIVDGAGVADAVLSAPTVELLPALYECGARALAYARGLPGDEPGRAETLDGLDGLAAEARAALK
ncbi:hypothetical protein AB0I28_08975 [Phytomonospora sp. NPDC050363]|uniref:hypothetical protein n=1 Tax=Phytomonospora sp. NPDC050363 TaxID=3155642 RepID=UPI0033DED8AA